jgi:putative tributyrin esterase
MAFIQWDFYSESLQIATSANIIIPQKSVQTSQKIPVLYLLHGLSDDHTIWQRRTAIERYVDQKNLVVIMPAVNRSFYTNTTSGTLYWDFISKELPHLCKRFFPISTKRADTFVAGLSMGGYGAFKLALNLPNKFAAAASLSGALDISNRIKNSKSDPAQNKEMINIFGCKENLSNSENNLFFKIKSLSKQKRQPHLFQWCGKDDLLYAENKKFYNQAKKLGIKINYSQSPGGHTWDHWDNQIEKVIRWLPISS